MNRWISVCFAAILVGACGGGDTPVLVVDNQEEEPENSQNQPANHGENQEEPTNQEENSQNQSANHGENDDENQEEPTNQAEFEVAVEIVDGPPTLSADADAQFGLECVHDHPAPAPECEYECALDDEAFQACDDAPTVSGLADGEHQFRVRASLGERQSEVATWEWTVDTTAPAVTIASGPEELSNEGLASFEFECSEADCEYECSYEEGAYESCDSDYDLVAAEGTQTLDVRAIDGAGNQGPASRWEWTVDTTAPAVTIASGPEALSNEGLASFEFGCSEADCEFECRVDGQNFESCPSDYAIAVDDGEHVLEVRAVDVASNESGLAQWEWTVDTTAPDLQFTATPPAQTDDFSAQFEFECVNEPCLMECTLDFDDDGQIVAGTWSECESPQDEMVGQAGDYIFRVRATDEAGNQSEISQAWTVTSERWVQVGAGQSSACAIDSEQKLWCWGENNQGQLGVGDTQNRAEPVQVAAGTAEETGWVQVSMGRWHGCGIRENSGDRSLWCWGSGFDGRLGQGNTISYLTPVQVGEDNGQATGWEEIAVGGHHSCAIREDGGDRSLWCWGRGNSDQLGVGSASDRDEPTQVMADEVDAPQWVTLASGAFHSCAIGEVDGDQTLWCWGRGDEGRLGLDSAADVGTPQQVGQGQEYAQGWQSLALGTRHSCAIREEGVERQLWCWGAGDYGALGLGDGNDRLVPEQVGTDTDWQSLALGNVNGCGLRGDGSQSTLWCWGWGQLGQLGSGDVRDFDEPTEVDLDATTSANIAQLSLGSAYSCAISEDVENNLFCTGINTSGQLGLGMTHGDELSPVSLASSLTFDEMSTGENHGCGVAVDSTLWCWGRNTSGQLGLGDDRLRSRPTQVIVDGIADTGWLNVAAGRDHNCAIREDNGERTLWCWGEGNYGQLGLDANASEDRPQQVAEGTAIESGWEALSAGAWHSCAIRDDGNDRTLWCWGRNADGQLGTGDTTDQWTPAQTGFGEDSETGWDHVSVAFAHTCGVRDVAGERTLWCWGQGGKTGLESSSTQLWPAQVKEGTALAAGWDSVTAGSNHSCAIRDDESLWCWGVNIWGQLGQGDTQTRSEPVQVGTDTGWKAVGMGRFHTCATRQEGGENRLWCWGDGDSGATGHGDRDERLSPQAVSGPGATEDWQSLSVWAEHSGGLTASGTVYMWGRNDYGQLGNGTYLSTLFRQLLSP